MKTGLFSTPRRRLLLLAVVALVAGGGFVVVRGFPPPVRVTVVSLYLVPGSKNTLIYGSIRNEGSKLFFYEDMMFARGDRLNVPLHAGPVMRLKPGDAITNVVFLPADGSTGTVRAFGYYPGLKLPAAFRFAQPLLDRYNARKSGANYFDSEETIVAPRYDGDTLMRPAMVLRPDGTILTNAPLPAGSNAPPPRAN
jgi:hypothetical protein